MIEVLFNGCPILTVVYQQCAECSHLSNDYKYVLFLCAEKEKKSKIYYKFMNDIDTVCMCVCVLDV